MGAIIQRSVKRGNVLSFDESYKLGYKSAWASEVDEDFDILFNAWNSGLDGSLALADGSVTTAKLADNSVTEPKIAAGAVTDGKIVSVSWSKLTGVPPLSATGPAGGVLTGTYPDPGLADHVVLEDNILNEAVTSNKIADEAITSPKLAPGAVNFPSIGNGEVGRIKISADAWLSPIPLGADVGKVLTVNAGPALAWVTPTSGGGAPSGPAGGDLTGFYPNPLIGTGRVTDAMIAGVSWAKITGAPASFPPSGSASGSLSGVYPNPSLAVNSVGQTQIVNGAVLRAKCAADTWLSPIPIGADVGKVLTVGAGPALGWATPSGGGGIPEAPLDGQTYGRNNAAWVTAGGAPLWSEDPTTGFLTPNPAETTSNCGILLDDNGSQTGLRFLPSSGISTARLTGIGADDTFLYVRGASGGIAFKDQDDGGTLAQIYADGRMSVGADPTFALDVATKQYVDASGGGGSSEWIFDGSNTLAPTRPEVGQLKLPLSATLLGGDFAGDYGSISLDSASLAIETSDPAGEIALILGGSPLYSFGATVGRLHRPLVVQLPAHGQTAGIELYAPTSSPSRLRFGETTPGNFSLYANVQLNNVLDDPGQPGLAWLFDGPAREFGFYSTPAGATAAWQYMCAISPAGLKLPSGILNIAGVNGEAAIFGARTVKHRIYVATAADVFSLAVNRAFGGVPDDPAQPAWQFRMGLDNDAITMTRFPVGSPVTGTAMLTVASNGNLTTKGSLIVGDPALYSNIQVGGKGSISGDALSLVEISTNSQGKLVDLVNYAQMLFRLDAAPGIERATWYHKPPNTGSLAAFAYLNPAGLTLVGSTAIKASGTAWTNPSDRRLKDHITDYVLGLEEVCALRPRVFIFNGKGGSKAGQVSAGFIADEVLGALPDMFFTRRGRLNEMDPDEVDIQMLDQSNLVLALVNAVKELRTRVELLET